MTWEARVPSSAITPRRKSGVCSRLARTSDTPRLSLRCLCCFWPAPDDEALGFYDISPGPTVGVAIMAWILGTAGAIVTLVLFRRATIDQDGPFRKCVANAGGVNANAGGVKAGAPAAAAAPAAAPAANYPTSGTV